MLYLGINNKAFPLLSSMVQQLMEESTAYGELIAQYKGETYVHTKESVTASMNILRTEITEKIQN